mgnify:FL=1
MEQTGSLRLAINKQTLAIIAILTGTFLVPVNSTMITIGLASITETFSTTLTNVSWVVTIYLIIMIVTQPIAGKLGDMYGNRNMFLIGLALFLIASIVCIYAQNLTMLIIGRAIQAIGGALISPNGTAILRFITPKEQLAKVFGLFGFSMSIGAAIGPLLGAFLINTWDWHSTFWINIPLATLSLVCSYKFLPIIDRRKNTALDLLGSALLTMFLATVVLLVTYSLYSNLWMWLIIVISFVLFVYREKTYTHPLIDFALFKQMSFTSANLFILLNNGIMYSTLLLMPIILAIDHHFTMTEIGLLLFVFSVSISIFSWIGGNIDQKLGRANTIGLSFCCSALALCLYSLLPSSESLVVAASILFFSGIGSGLGVPSMQAASLQAVEKEKSGVASGIYSTFRYIGSTAASVMISLQISYTINIIILISCALIGIMTAAFMHRVQLKM